jgi:hypothetical protein
MTSSKADHKAEHLAFSNSQDYGAITFTTFQLVYFVTSVRLGRLLIKKGLDLKSSITMIGLLPGTFAETQQLVLFKMLITFTTTNPN